MNHMKSIYLKQFLLVVCIFVMNSSFSQNITANDSSSVVVHKDPRLDLLVKKQVQINEETSRLARRTMKGYRLLVINTNKREDAINAKTQVYTYFPELKAYLTYQSPYFKLKAGNFKTRDEAEDYQKKLNAIFSKGVFIMADIIEVKPEKTENF
jgi:Sporulation related domain.